jgi:hypothetical protein
LKAQKANILVYSTSLAHLQTFVLSLSKVILDQFRHAMTWQLLEATNILELRMAASAGLEIT